MTDRESSAETASHLSELRGAVSKIRPSRLSWSDKWLLIIGSALLPLGVGLILLGWYGSAQTTLDWEQTPYLISGGILGLGLLGLGAATYFAYWMTRLVRSNEESVRRDREHQQRVEQLLGELVAAQGAGARPGRAQWLAGGDPKATQACAWACSRGEEDAESVAASVGTLGVRLADRLAEADSWL